MPLRYRCTPHTVCEFRSIHDSILSNSDVNGASRQPTSRQNRHSEADNDAGIARKRRRQYSQQRNAGMHSHECSQVMVKLRRQRCLGHVDAMCDKFDSR